MAMTEIYFVSASVFVTLIWVLFRMICCFISKKFDFKRELRLLLVYVCIMVVMRVTFFPFEKVEDEIQPLLFSFDKILPFRINFVPFVNLFDYPEKRSAWLNVIGNTTMFIPIGIIWPTVFKKLDSHKKVILSGIGFSAFVEILQLPFFDRVTDIDDLILNSIGFAVGYLIYLLIKKLH